MIRAAAIAVLVAAAPAAANDLPRFDVYVGTTAEVSVAAARGWMCDDPSLVDAEVVTRGDHNVWRVTGVKLGETTCRVGTNPYGVHYIYDVHVLPRPAKPRT